MSFGFDYDGEDTPEDLYDRTESWTVRGWLSFRRAINRTAKRASVT